MPLFALFSPRSHARVDTADGMEQKARASDHFAVR
jgi:hypothetical protein